MFFYSPIILFAFLKSINSFIYLGGEDQKAAPDEVLEDETKQGGAEVGHTDQQGTVCGLQRAGGILN